jgi:osmotically-inducible protein OsmY
MSTDHLLPVLAVGVVFAGGLQGCAAYTECATAACVADADTATRVRALFEQYPELQPPNLLYVLARGDLVTISGTVNTDYTRRMAESVALQANGVRRVANLLGVDNGGK